MKILLAGGTGLIGKALTEFWRGSDHDITVLGRSKSRIQQTFGDTVNALSWDEFEQAAAELLPATDFVINLCGQRLDTGRWTEAFKQKLIDSRQHPTQRLVDAINACSKPPHLLNASGVSIYGLQSGQRANLPTAFIEDSPINENAPGFLPKLARDWEAAAIRTKGDVTLLRFAPVFAKHDGALAKMATPFKFGVGGPIGNGLQPFAWVGLIDVCRAIDFLMQHPDITGPVNIAGVQCCRQVELAHSLGAALHRPVLLPLPEFAVKLLFGQMGDELLLHGQHVIPNRLLERGFEFNFADVDGLLRAYYC